VHQDQSVYEMVEEVLERQAKVVLERSGCSPQEALDAVIQTDAGRQLGGLRDGPRAQEEARDWQEGLLWERAFERLEGMVRLDAGSRFATEGPYSWVEVYMERLEGKEARAEYYVLLEAAELPSLARQPERMSSSGWGTHLRV
jgi:hypothetical protein